jgi:hypothetical protein
MIAGMRQAGRCGGCDIGAEVRGNGMAHRDTHITMAGLERAARCTGEAFGHDEVAGYGDAAFQSGWRARLTAGFSAMLGRLVPGAR